MRNILKTAVLCLAAALAACGGKTGYTLDVELAGLADGTMISLTPAGTHDEEKPVATHPLKDGRVTFTGEVEGPRFFAVSVDGGYGRVALFLDKGYDAKVTARVSRSEQGGNTVYEFSDTVISGSPLTDEYNAKIAFRNDFDRMYNEYHERGAEVSNQLREAYIAGDEKKMEEIRRSDAYLQYAREEKEFFDTVEEMSNNAILGEKESWWGPFLMLNLMTYFSPEQQPLFEQFSQQAQDSYYGRLVSKELFPESFMGKNVPAFTVTDSDGQEHTLAELLEGNKYVLIDFWASWCGPCRREIPNLKKEYEAYAAKGFEIISISTDKKEEDWLKALEEEQLPWPNFRDMDGSIADEYGVRSIPALFLVDANGILVGQDIRGEALGAKLAELFD